MKFDSSSCILKPVYFACVKTMLEFFFANYTFCQITSKIIAMIALRRAILMKADPVVSLHANRLLSGRGCSCKKDPCCLSYGQKLQIFHDSIVAQFPKETWAHRKPNLIQECNQNAWIHVRIFLYRTWAITNYYQEPMNSCNYQLISDLLQSYFFFRYFL